MQDVSAIESERAEAVTSVEERNKMLFSIVSVTLLLQTSESDLRWNDLLGLDFKIYNLSDSKNLIQNTISKFPLSTCCLQRGGASWKVKPDPNDFDIYFVAMHSIMNTIKRVFNC